MEYTYFLFTQLYLAYSDSDITSMPYDDLYPIIMQKYGEYDNSPYNDNNIGEYQCIINWLDNEFSTEQSKVKEQ